MNINDGMLVQMSEFVGLFALVGVFIFFVAFIGLLRRGYRNTHDLRVTEVCPEKHSAGTTLNVVQISDMHLEHLTIKPEQIQAALADEKIDVIALTGDYMDRRRSLPKLEPYLVALRALRPTYGIFAVLGNHDYLLRPKDLERLREIFCKHGVRLLENEHEMLHVDGRTVRLIGVDDYKTRRSDLRKSFAGISGDCNIVLTHDPNVVLEMRHLQFDYLMAGHFHGGQIHWPKPYHLLKMGRLARQNRVSGLHFEHGRAFYINEGLGQTGVSLRLGTRPEITIHRLSLQRAADVSAVV
jgi:hypothetical protein